MKTAASKENVSEKILNPLILAGWHASTDAEKRNRLIEHVEFSEKHGFLEETNSFLRSLSDEDWHRCPEEELNATSSMDLMMKDYED
jgi:hypothetical protein